MRISGLFLRKFFHACVLCVLIFTYVFHAYSMRIECVLHAYFAYKFARLRILRIMRKNRIMRKMRMMRIKFPECFLCVFHAYFMRIICTNFRVCVSCVFCVKCV